MKGQELIFVSPKAVRDGTKAIRGGIPICWPSFGPWSEGPQHGFARTSRWEVEASSLTDRFVRLVVLLEDRLVGVGNSVCHEHDGLVSLGSNLK